MESRTRRRAIARGLYYVGTALTILGLIFVTEKLLSYDFGGLGYVFSPSGILLLIVLSLVIAITSFALAFAWWNLICLNAEGVTRDWALVTYALSQPAKYVPGNVLNLVTRQAMGMAAAIPAWTLAKASGWELCLIVVSGMVVSLLAAPLVLPWLSQLATVTIVSAFMAVLLLLAYKTFDSRVVHALMWQVLFFVVSGSVYALLILWIVPSSIDPNLNWLALAGACVAAWIVGMVTPGAPAGLGVREIILISLLENYIQHADLLLGVVLGRGVTVVGDVLFVGLALIWRSRRMRPDVA